MKGYQSGTNIPATFQTDLLEQHNNEHQLGQWCANNYNCKYTTTQSNGSDSRYDVLLYDFADGSPDVTIELKHDKQTHKFNNVAVEFKRTYADGSTKPTCISVSKADIWCYLYDDSYHFIETTELRKLIQERKYKDTRDNAGEGNRASIYRFDKDFFNEQCIIKSIQ